MAGMSKAEGDAFMGEYFAFTEGIKNRPLRGWRGAEAGAHGHHGSYPERQDVDNRRPVRRDEGATRRVLLIEAKDLNEAIQIAAKIPSARRQRRSAAHRGVRLKTVSPLRLYDATIRFCERCSVASSPCASDASTVAPAASLL